MYLTKTTVSHEKQRQPTSFYGLIDHAPSQNVRERNIIQIHKRQIFVTMQFSQTCWRSTPSASKKSIFDLISFTLQRYECCWNKKKKIWNVCKKLKDFVLLFSCFFSFQSITRANTKLQILFHIKTHEQQNPNNLSHQLLSQP